MNETLCLMYERVPYGKGSMHRVQKGKPGVEPAVLISMSSGSRTGQSKRSSSASDTRRCGHHGHADDGRIQFGKSGCANAESTDTD